MGVYIKGMKMPETCRSCRLSTVVASGEQPLCDVLVQYMSFEKWKTKRLDNCPLVPIPPHGRLIDADAFVRSIRDAIHYDASRGREYISAEDLHEALTNAPTIIPAEEGEA